MSAVTQGIIIAVGEIMALFYGIVQIKRKDADAVTQFCGLYVIIAVSLVVLIEIGLAISYAVNPW